MSDGILLMHMGYRVVAASWWIQDAEARLFDVYGIHTGWDTGCIYEIVRHREH